MRRLTRTNHRIFNGNFSFFLFYFILGIFIFGRWSSFLLVFFSSFFAFVSVKWLFAWFRLLYAEEVCNCYGLNNKLHSYTFILVSVLFFFFYSASSASSVFLLLASFELFFCKAAEIILTSWIKGLNICVNLWFFNFLMMKTKTDLPNVQENTCSWKYNYCFHLSIKFIRR